MRKVNNSAQGCVVLTTAHSIPTLPLFSGIHYLTGGGPTRWN